MAKSKPATANNTRGGRLDLGSVSYVLGILSIVMAFWAPGAGLVLGIVGYIHGKNNNVPQAKRLNLVGILVSLALIAVSFALAYTCTVNPESVYCQGII